MNTFYPPKFSPKIIRSSGKTEPLVVVEYLLDLKLIYMIQHLWQIWRLSYLFPATNIYIYAPYNTNPTMTHLHYTVQRVFIQTLSTWAKFSKYSARWRFYPTRNYVGRWTWPSKSQSSAWSRSKPSSYWCSTCGNNILDLLFCTCPAFISNVQVVLGISDHEAIILTVGAAFLWMHLITVYLCTTKLT